MDHYIICWQHLGIRLRKRQSLWVVKNWPHWSINGQIKKWSAETLQSFDAVYFIFTFSYKLLETKFYYVLIFIAFKWYLNGLKSSNDLQNTHTMKFILLLKEAGMMLSKLLLKIMSYFLWGYLKNLLEKTPFLKIQSFYPNCKIFQM